MVEYVIDKPGKSSKIGIILVPGISGKPFADERFIKLAKVMTEAGYNFLRYESWKGEKDLERKTIKVLHSEFDGAVEFLKSKDCSRIGFVGKSFGGGVLLTYRNPDVKCIVLWAPAIGVGDKSNVEEWMDVKLEKLKSLTDIKVSEEFLSNLEIPVRILHGTKDEIVPLENSKMIVEVLQDGELIEIEGADHSYKTPGHERKVIEITLDIIKSNLPL